MQTRVILVTLVTLFATLTTIQCSREQMDLTFSSESRKEECVLRTGLQKSDISQAVLKNNDCAIDCVTNAGTIMEYYVKNGEVCWKPGYICNLGNCVPKDEPPKVKDQLFDVVIKVKSAEVEDRDPMIGQGKSDPYVVIELVRGGGPTHRDGEIICHTFVIQDTSYPRWDFTCKPLPMPETAELKFWVFDSDKPQQSDSLGYVIRSLADIKNENVLLPIRDGKYSGILEVEVNTREYKVE